MARASTPPPAPVSLDRPSEPVLLERCPRCGGNGAPPRRRQNPFLIGLDTTIVCEDCGMNFPGALPPPPSSGRPPW
ncbi:hypothetical protein [Polyangium aurulentum]|uniref:hypothetical protein n=1 Tax=Polyangium aurulentum TaxID=2567896 RepID=UPI0010AEC7FF|nr:hypothetical protein [Polyangium aurulentum]UQA57903.1 hypothetical protein E8A73_042635 [Polyangium aurulentum]